MGEIRTKHDRYATVFIVVFVMYFNSFLSANPPPALPNPWNNYNPYNGNFTYRASFPSPSGGIIYRNSPDGKRISKNPNKNDNFMDTPHPQPNYNRIFVGEICDPEDPYYNKCTNHAECVPGENNRHLCNCSQNYEATSDKKCRLAFGKQCSNKDQCNPEAGLLCVDNKCECENSELYQYHGKSCRSKVGGTCTPPATELGIRFSKFSTGCLKNAICKSYGPNGLSFRCVCKPGFVENRLGYCTAGVGMSCNKKGDCDNNIPLVCKQGICSCRDSLHAYDPESNSCVGLAGAQCCTDPEGQRCISVLRTGCVEGAYCKETSMNLPGRCICLPFNVETEDRLCKPNLN